MTTRFPVSYYCQDPQCGHVVKTTEMQYGNTCPKCSKAKLDDWPPDAEGPVTDLSDEQGLDYFNRFIAGDR